MDQQRFKEIFEDKYERPLGLSFEQWLEASPKTEQQAYDRLDHLDKEIKGLRDKQEGVDSDTRFAQQEEIDRLKLEYELLEEMFGLEAWDADW